MSAALRQSDILAPPAQRPAVLVSAVIPCLNEARTIAACVEKAIGAFAALGVTGEVVVADNGSTDGSIELAQCAGARVVSETRKGYGAALQCGIENARGQIIVMADADESYDWSAIGPFVRKIQEGFDLVMGNRFRGGIAPGAMPPLHRYLGNPVLSALARIAFRTPIGDFHCGMRAFTREAFARMQPTTTGMEFATEMVANAAHQRLRIAEVPTRLYPDKRGRPPHLRSFRDGWRHLRFILTYAPDHLYLLPGFAMLFAGLVLEGALVAGPLRIGQFQLGIHFVALGAVLTLVGFNLLNLGVFAKVLMSQRYSGLKSRTVAFIRNHFRLEHGLIAGALLAIPGLAVDGTLLAHWLRHFGQSMEGSVHLAFVASTAIALGSNIAFSSFLLNMITPPEAQKKL